jgi:hypothetical protein
MTIRMILAALTAIGAVAAAQASLAQQPMRAYDKSFLTNYDLLKPRQGKAGQPGDLAYVAPGALEKLRTYNAIMVDQPAIHFSPDSPVKGMKPDDLKALSENLRDALSARLAEGGYPVAQKPEPGVLFLRVGLTDLVVKKKPRNLLAYTPVGAVVKGAADAVRDTFSKVDFIEMTFQAELVDSQTEEVLGALVAPRGARKAEGQKETRIDLEELNQNTRIWGLRLRCQLENSKVSAGQQSDCTDDAANIAKYGR